MTAHVVAVVPIRSFRDGKTRLAPSLDRVSREALMRQMANGVTRALAGTTTVASTIVVSPDPDVLAWAASGTPSIVPIEQPVNTPGLDAAIDAGRRLAQSAGASSMLSLFADLPLVTPCDIDDLVAGAGAVVLGTDRSGTGTNALLLPLDARGMEFRFSFGPCSLAKHLAEAERIGLIADVRHIPGIAFDLDTPVDLFDLKSGSNDGCWASERANVACGVRQR